MWHQAPSTLVKVTTLQSVQHQATTETDAYYRLDLITVKYLVAPNPKT